MPDVAARRGEFSALIQEGVGDAWPGPWAEHDLRTDAPAPAHDAASAFILTGSSSNVTEQAAWMTRAVPWLRALVRSGTPVLGICFGHQILAHALGGTVTKNPRGREIGTVDVAKVGDDPLFAGLGDPFPVNATHVESVVALPAGARLLATTALDPHAAYALGDRVRCVQFHPEIDGDVMRSYITARAQFMRDEGLDPASTLSGAHDASGRAILRAFVGAFVR